MKELNIKNKKIYFIGICGVSMSALVNLSLSCDAIVEGSDISVECTKFDKNIKYKIHNQQYIDNIKKFMPDIVVYTSAVTNDNIELVWAKNNMVEIFERSEFLGYLCCDYKNVIAIAGTHGKTTVSCMIAEIFVRAGFNPTVHIGGNSINLKSNYLCGSNDYFITEACEYKRSFEKIKPTCALVTNVDSDHMECYGSLKKLQTALDVFSSSANISIKSCDEMSVSVKKYNSNKIEKISATNLLCANGCYNFDCMLDDEFIFSVRLGVIGKYNIQNALCSIAVALCYGIDKNTIYNALLHFNGVERRNQKMLSSGGTDIFMDYCHHPTEIANCLQAYKSIYSKILVVFQPHTYSRTKLLKEKFAVCFNDCQKVIIYKTFAAREDYDGLGDQTILYDCITNSNKSLCLDIDSLNNKLKNEFYNYNCILILGAGNLHAELNLSYFA